MELSLEKTNQAHSALSEGTGEGLFSPADFGRTATETFSNPEMWPFAADTFL